MRNETKISLIFEAAPKKPARFSSLAVSFLLSLGPIYAVLGKVEKTSKKVDGGRW